MSQNSFAARAVRLHRGAALEIAHWIQGVLARFLPQRCLAATLGCAFILTLGIQPALLRAQTFTDLHDFNCSSDGCNPDMAGIVAQGTDGNLYGTLTDGGAGCGSVYRITPGGALNDIYNFSGADGCNPYVSVVRTYETSLAHGPSYTFESSSPLSSRFERLRL